MILETDSHILAVGTRFSVGAIENQRPRGLNPCALAELRYIERICVADSRLFCILLRDGTRVYDLYLQRRFSRAVVRGEIGVIGLEGNMEIPIRLELSRGDGSADLHGDRCLISASDYLEPIGVRTSSGKLVIDVLPELILQGLVKLRRAVGRDSLLQACHDGSSQRRFVNGSGCPR